MFWRKSRKRTDEFSVVRDSEQRAELRKNLNSLFAQGHDAEFTIRLLERKLPENVSLAQLALALSELQAEGRIDRVLRVESPETHGGIEDFSSLADVPETIYDWRTDRTIEVTPEIISTIFRAHRNKELAHANG